jgi:hypothetical protein
MNRHNKRRHDRFQSSAPVTLRWREDSGEARLGRGTVLDYSEHGLRIELEDLIQFTSYVVVGAPGQNKKACAGKIRYCLTKQTKYIVGLEFGPHVSPAHPDAAPDFSDVLQNSQFSMLMFRP